MLRRSFLNPFPAISRFIPTDFAEDPGILGQIGMGTGVPGLAGLPMAGFGGNAAASSFMGIAPMLMQLMASGEGFATAGSMDGLFGMGAGSQSQEMFDDGGTIAEALQKVAKAVVSQVRK